ncbi:hypothetical protein SELMODRAFT_418158 [Selaginella moellendorffii]|uniref:Uncharacterized protein n=1 Tax=Selaginella moellendorffii TaxID=88036 RepID=D8S4V2_SELML|nr:hypothetical protein SELMODRAFT_418158 [Selaginella moellendorffii]
MIQAYRVLKKYIVPIDGEKIDRAQLKKIIRHALKSPDSDYLVGNLFVSPEVVALENARYGAGLVAQYIKLPCVEQSTWSIVRVDRPSFEARRMVVHEQILQGLCRRRGPTGEFGGRYLHRFVEYCHIRSDTGWREISSSAALEVDMLYSVRVPVHVVLLGARLKSPLEVGSKKEVFCAASHACRLCEIPSGVKRICLGDDFGKAFLPSGNVEFYDLFSRMFPGGSVEELEAGAYDWFPFESEFPAVVHCIGAKKDDIKAIAKAASNLVYSCDVQCVSTISPRDKREVWRWQRTNLPDPTSFESLLLGESTRS